MKHLLPSLLVTVSMTLTTAMGMEDPNKDNPLLSLAPETHFKIIGHRLDLSEEQVNILSKLGQQDGLNTLTDAQWDVFKSLNFKGIKDINHLFQTCKGINTLTKDIMKGLKTFTGVYNLIDHLGSFGIELNDEMFISETEDLLKIIPTQKWKDFMVLMNQHWVSMYHERDIIYKLVQNSPAEQIFQWLAGKQYAADVCFEKIVNVQEKGVVDIAFKSLILLPLQLITNKELGMQIVKLNLWSNCLIMIPQKMIDNMPNLTELNIFDNLIGTLPDLSHTKIECLFFGKNPLSSEQIKNLPPSLKKIPMNTFGLKKFPESIITLRNLEGLRLTGNQITTTFLKDGRNWIKELIKNNPQLDYIFLSNNKFNFKSRMTLWWLKIKYHKSNPIMQHILRTRKIEIQY